MVGRKRKTCTKKSSASKKRSITPDNTDNDAESAFLTQSASNNDSTAACHSCDDGTTSMNNNLLTSSKVLEASAAATSKKTSNTSLASEHDKRSILMDHEEPPSSLLLEDSVLLFSDPPSEIGRKSEREDANAREDSLEEGTSIEVTVFPATDGTDKHEFIFAPIEKGSGSAVDVSSDADNLHHPRRRLKKFNTGTRRKKKKKPAPESLNNVDSDPSSTSSTSIQSISSSPPNSPVVIDIEKLPDLPDSPIGDDIVELRCVVDLTDDVDDEDTADPVDAMLDDAILFNDAIEVMRRHAEEFSSSESSETRSSTTTLSSDAVDDELPAVNFLKSREEAPTEHGWESHSKQGIMCPVCMDTRKQISESDRHLVSTMCGHIFCDVCIKEAVSVQKKCPTCRKKLTPKQLHPIYL